MARARISTRVASVPKCLYESAPDSLKKSGALMYFHNLCGVPATLEAAPEGSESVHAEIVRFALVLPAFVLARQGFAAQKYVEPPRKRAEPESSSFSGVENIRESQ